MQAILADSQNGIYYEVEAHGKHVVNLVNRGRWVRRRPISRPREVDES